MTMPRWLILLLAAEAVLDITIIWAGYVSVH